MTYSNNASQLIEVVTDTTKNTAEILLNRPSKQHQRYQTIGSPRTCRALSVSCPRLHLVDAIEPRTRRVHSASLRECLTDTGPFPLYSHSGNSFCDCSEAYLSSFKSLKITSHSELLPLTSDFQSITQAVSFVVTKCKHNPQPYREIMCCPAVNCSQTFAMIHPNEAYRIGKHSFKYSKSDSGGTFYSAKPLEVMGLSKHPSSVSLPTKKHVFPKLLHLASISTMRISDREHCPCLESRICQDLCPAPKDLYIAYASRRTHEMHGEGTNDHINFAPESKNTGFSDEIAASGHKSLGNKVSGKMQSSFGNSSKSSTHDTVACISEKYSDSYNLIDNVAVEIRQCAVSLECTADHRDIFDTHIGEPSLVNVSVHSQSDADYRAQNLVEKESLFISQAEEPTDGPNIRPEQDLVSLKELSSITTHSSFGTLPTYNEDETASTKFQTLQIMSTDSKPISGQRGSEHLNSESVISQTEKEKKVDSIDEEERVNKRFLHPSDIDCSKLIGTMKSIEKTPSKCINLQLEFVGISSYLVENIFELTIPLEIILKPIYLQRMGVEMRYKPTTTIPEHRSRLAASSKPLFNLTFGRSYIILTSEAGKSLHDLKIDLSPISNSNQPKDIGFSSALTSRGTCTPQDWKETWTLEPIVLYKKRHRKSMKTLSAISFSFNNSDRVDRHEPFEQVHITMNQKVAKELEKTSPCLPNPSSQSSSSPHSSSSKTSSKSSETKRCSANIPDLVPLDLSPNKKVADEFEKTPTSSSSSSRISSSSKFSELKEGLVITEGKSIAVSTSPAEFNDPISLKMPSSDSVSCLPYPLIFKLKSCCNSNSERLVDCSCDLNTSCLPQCQNSAILVSRAHHKEPIEMRLDLLQTIRVVEAGNHSGGLGNDGRSCHGNSSNPSSKQYRKNSSHEDILADAYRKVRNIISISWAHLC